jgi:PAS domain S-box-containing protein
MRARLETLIEVNERGMFGLAQGNETLSRRVLVGTLIYFIVSLGLAILFADNLSQRLSRPLKSIVEALHLRPKFDRKLKLPEPTTLELLILTTELKRLWERLGETEKVNVAELLEQKSKLETVLESVEDGLLVLGPDGKVSHCNDRLAKLIGLTRDEVQDRPWTDLPTLHENYLKLRSTLREGMPESQQVDLEWNQALAYFSARSRPIEIDRNHPRAGTLFLLHDITEKKQREKFRTEFIDLLSHELKTPLQSLGTAAELLHARRADFPEDVALLVETVSEDVERIRAVAHEFVQVTQSHSKVMKINLALVALNQGLREWIKPFYVVARDRGVALEFAQEGSDVIWANVDSVKFPWVVSNILSNAIRFSPRGSAVRVLLTDRAGSVEIRIRDEGPGIAETDRDRIFEPFYQGAVIAASGLRGLFGIGLTIAKEVVEAHDGRIEYQPVLPQGSEFRILLPFPPVQYGET